MQFPDGYPEPLQTIANAVSASLVRSGIDQATADQAAFAGVEDARFTHGGETMYFPSGKIYEISQQHEEIWQRFNGRNVAELAKQYDHSERHILRVIEAMRARDMAKRQPKLF